jgi:hypothetical protein
VPDKTPAPGWIFALLIALGLSQTAALAVRASWLGAVFSGVLLCALVLRLLIGAPMTWREPNGLVKALLAGSLTIAIVAALALAVT